MRLQVSSEPRPLQDVADDIERLIRVRTGGTVRGLRVELHDDSVVLLGRASTYYAKQKATQAALEAADDFTLTNNIEVC